MVGALEGAAPAVRRIWLPPLPDAVTLDAAAGPVRVSERGLHLARAAGGMRVPLGVLDDPARQWQGRWELDLTTAGGHVAVIGGPQSGKTTLLRTFVLSLAVTHTPRDVAVYGLDLVGGRPSALAAPPRVGVIAARAGRAPAAQLVSRGTS